LPKTEKIRPCPGDTGNRKFEQKSRKLKNQACLLPFSFSKKGWSTITGNFFYQILFSRKFSFLKGQYYSGENVPIR
jgi:hypothetical protein